MEGGQKEEGDLRVRRRERADQVPQQAAAVRAGQCVREGRVRVQAPVLGVKNRGKQHFDATGVWVQRALDKDEVAALGGAGEEEGVERALADLLEEAVLRHDNIDGDDLELGDEARGGLLRVLQDDVHRDLDPAPRNRDVDGVEGGIINAGLQLTHTKRPNFVALTALDEGGHFPVEHAREHIGIVPDVLAPPVAGACHEQLHLAGVGKGIQTVHTGNRTLRLKGLGRCV